MRFPSVFLVTVLAASNLVATAAPQTPPAPACERPIRPGEHARTLDGVIVLNTGEPGDGWIWIGYSHDSSGFHSYVRFDHHAHGVVKDADASNRIEIASSSRVVIRAMGCTDPDNPPGTEMGNGGINVTGSNNQVTVIGSGNDIDVGGDTTRNQLDVTGANNDIDMNGSSNPPPVVYGTGNSVHD